MITELTVFVSVQKFVVMIDVVLPVILIILGLNEMLFDVGLVLLEADFTISVLICLSDVCFQIISCTFFPSTRFLISKSMLFHR